MLKFRNNLIIALCLFSLIIFTGCSGGISRDDAKAHINGFFDAVEASDFEKAETFLHPERPADLEEFFDTMKNDEQLDFTSFEITKYTGFSSAYYDSSVGGSTYKLRFNADVGDVSTSIEIEIVKNDNGYGIYNFNIDKK